MPLASKEQSKGRARTVENGSAAKRTVGQRTLCIDIGGTGLKALVLDERGHKLTERVRVDTPRPATPDAIVGALLALVEPLAPFDRVSVGFPGVVVGGATRTAPNLDPTWANFELRESLEARLKKPVRVLNDAGVQGFGVIDGKGVEMVITMGTGMGCALYIDGKYVPNLELAHHPFRGKKTYEDYVGNAAYEKVGKKKWNKRVAEVLDQINPIWNPRRLYVGGGNAKHIKLKLPPNVRITDNVAGLLGGIRLWEER
jgi:polyphosphate glucokinase